MAQPNRDNITYLTGELPRLIISESGGCLWANLWYGYNEAGKPVRVATKQIDRRIYQLAEVDYHRDVLDELLDKFAEERTKALAKAKVEPKAAAPKTVEQAEGLAKKVAKKITKKKSKA